MVDLSWPRCGPRSARPARVGPAQWDEPTDCPGWSVRDNASHLVGIERMLPRIAAASATTSHPRPTILGGDQRSVGPGTSGRSRGPTSCAEVRPSDRPAARGAPVDVGRTVRRRVAELFWQTPYRQFTEIRVIDSGPTNSASAGGLLPRRAQRDGESVVMDGWRRNMDRITGECVPKTVRSCSSTSRGCLAGRSPSSCEVAGEPWSTSKQPAHPPRRCPWTRGVLAFVLRAGGANRLLGTGQVRVDGDVVVGHKVLDAMAFIT